MPYRPTANYRECLHLNEIPDATATEAGVMSAADKAKLDTLVAGGSAPLATAAQVSEQPARRGRRRRPARSKRDCACCPVCTVRWRLTFFAFKLDVRISVPCGRLKRG